MPVGAVGGDIVRARLLNFSGVAGGATVASGSVDLLLQMAAQALFALIGFGIPPEAALALSFVKRVPDLAIGLPRARGSDTLNHQ